ncbi:MAG TPA: hypothetical protein PLP75_01280 [Burkholderiales bacterium]|nr:hypothetical protein [Burkholderiales bacterium]
MKLPNYDFCSPVILKSETFTENHRFINRKIKCLDFVIVDSILCNDEICIKTNHVFRKMDLDTRYKNEWDAEEYSSINITIPIQINHSGDWQNCQSAYHELFTPGKHFVLNNVSMSGDCIYGRAYLCMEFDEIISNKMPFNSCRIRLYQYGIDNYSPIISALIWSMGAEVIKLTDQQIEAENEASRLRWVEELRQLELRKAKQITSDKALEIIRLRDVEKLSFAQIAKMFGVAPSTISRSYKLTKITE